jgi:nucleoside-diphosphate-sugar epimerase
MNDCIIVTGRSGLIGSAFLDHIGEQFIEFGFDREGPPHSPLDHGARHGSSGAVRGPVECEVAQAPSTGETT